MITEKNILITDEIKEKPVLKASSNYMETLVKLEPVSGGSDIHAFMNDDKQIDLYSVGTDLGVYRLRPKNNAQAPYLLEDLKVNLEQLSLFQAIKGDNANPSILGINSAGQLALASFSGAYSQKVFQPSQASEKIRQFLSLRGVTGNIYANVLLNDDTLASNFFSPTDLKWKSERWVKVLDPNGNEAKVKSIAMCSNSQVQSSLFAIGKEDKFEDHVLFAEDSFTFTKMRDLAGKKVIDLSVVLDENKLLNIFGIEKDTGILWVKRQKKYSTNFKIDFDDWQKVANSATAFGTVKLKRVFANIRLDNFLEVFAIGEDGKLYHTYQLANSTAKQTWAEFFPLGNGVGNSIFTLARSYTGYSEAYTVTNDNLVMRFWQNPETSQWFSTLIEIEKTSQNVVSVPTHALEITVLDNDGVPQPNAEVGLSASFLTNLSINGLSYQASLVGKIKVKADTTGKLVINQRANSLAAASILIETEFTGAMPIQVEPNAQLQEKIKLTTADCVLNAKDKNGNYLLADKDRTRENAESIAKIMTSSMSLTGQNAGKQNFVYQSKGKLGNWSPNINMANVNEQHWEINFGGGFPTYKTLTFEEVSLYRQSNFDALGFLGIDWGDLWNAFKEGVGSVVSTIKRIIVSVGEVIKVAFEFIIDGITKVFETVIEFVQQAFDFVEGVWNWLKVKVEQLFEWLGFLFEWEDIRRTADIVKFNINTILDFSVVATDHVKGVFDTWIHELKDTLKEAVDHYINELGTGSTLGNYGDQYKKSDPEKEHALDHNILLNSVKENYKDASSVNEFKFFIEDNSPIMDLLDQMKALSENFEFGDGKQAFDEALGYFSNIKENPSQALQLVLSGLLKIGESVAMFLIDFGAGVVRTILDVVKLLIEAFKDLLNTAWRIPIVSDIFKFITGHDLSFSIIDLISYLIAIPTCVLFKVVYKQAPFPTDDSVTAFKNTYNLAYLKSRSGIDNSKEAILMRNAVQTVDPLVVNLFKTGFAVSMFVKIWSDIGTSIASSANQVSDVLGYVSLGAGITAAAFTNPWIVEVDPGKLLCGKSDAANGEASSNVGYLATVVSVVKGVVVYAVKKKNPQFPPTVVVKVNELSSTIAGSLRCVLYVVEYVLSSKKKPKTLARNLTAAIPGETLRFMSLNELNTGTFYIPEAILGVLTFGGYTSSLVIYLTDDDVSLLEAEDTLLENNIVQEII
ncbi:hypothetical protein [Flavobacterium sp. HJSW_4]|uniref:hypothetical protein n=1 Tax=Flavobacterium sp. HJSW_4 TaxID=3344660 RepID=UPI0035F4E3D0